jgi:hypothetical protein
MSAGGTRPTRQTQAQRIPHHFRILAVTNFTVGVIVLFYTVFLISSPYWSFSWNYQYEVSLPAATVIDFVLYAMCGTTFIAARQFVHRLGIPPWRDSCSEQARQGIELFVGMLSLSDGEIPGIAWTLSVILVILLTLGMVGAAAASVTSDPSHWPIGNFSHPQALGSSPGNGSDHQSSRTPVGNGKALGNGTTKPPLATNPSTKNSYQATTTTTVAGSVFPDRVCGSTQIKQDLVDALNHVIVTSVTAEYEDHYLDLQCLALDDSGQPMTIGVSNLNAIQFVSTTDNSLTGTIVYNEIGDAGEISGSESAFMNALSSSSGLSFVGDLTVISGAQLQLAPLENGSCVVAIRPDENSVWTVYPANEGPAILEVFIGMQQIGRPEGPDDFHFSFGRPDVTITSVDGHVAVQGPSADIVSAAESATTCPQLMTAQRDALQGPPAD